MLTQEEAGAILQLMGRVSLNGNEAEAVVALKQKLSQIAQGGGQNVTPPKVKKTNKK